ncbi:MAG: hypothetical protein P1V19_06855, partial [Gimesia sp.]|nr:hypothetical protein [Gimesia sp.]
MPVHPQVVQYLEQIANYDLPSFDEMTPELIRSTLTPSPEPHIPAKSIENLTLSINKAEIPIRIYTPAEKEAESDANFPALVYFHGG